MKGCSIIEKGVYEVPHSRNLVDAISIFRFSTKETLFDNGLVSGFAEIVGLKDKAS